VSYCTFADGYRHRLIKQAKRRRFRLFVSSFIVNELREVLVEALGCSRRYASLACRAVLRIARHVKISLPTPRHVPGDPNDDPIVQTAVGAGAHYLVTADKELLGLKKVRSVEIISLRRFEELLTDHW
jgi:predicted nucleic acid-binding protein